MVPLEIEVGYCEESEVDIGDPTQSLLRVHTDDCACRSTMELDATQSFLELLNASPSSHDTDEAPPTMCTDRLPGAYCPYGDPSDCNCLELFTSHVTSISDLQENPAYIEELLDELSSSLSDISDAFDTDSDSSTATGNDSEMISSNADDMVFGNASDSGLDTLDIQARFSQSIHLTSTPVHQRNPVLSSVASPLFDPNSPITIITEETEFGGKEDRTRSQGAFEQNRDMTVTATSSVFRNNNMDDSLELFGMAKLDEMEEGDGCDVTEEDQNEVYGQTWWALEGPHIYKMDCEVSQLVLPDSRQVDDSTTLFF